MWTRGGPKQSCNRFRPKSFRENRHSRGEKCAGTSPVERYGVIRWRVSNCEIGSGRNPLSRQTTPPSVERYGVIRRRVRTEVQNTEVCAAAAMQTVAIITAATCLYIYLLACGVVLRRRARWYCTARTPATVSTRLNRSRLRLSDLALRR